MTTNEKHISFLNNYFIYKKIRAPDAKELTLQTLSKVEELTESKSSIQQQMQIKRDVKKYKRKLKIPI